MNDMQNLSIGTKEGWQKVIEAPPRERPAVLALRKIQRMSQSELARYNKERRLWHANMGVLRTPALKALHEQLWDTIGSNAQDGARAKGAVALEGDSNLGKSTAVELFAKDFHLREIEENGALTDDGHERHPVVRVTLSGNPTIRDLNGSLLHYFNHAGRLRGSAGDFARRALDVFLDCEVRLLIIDDLHFLRWESADGTKVSNQLKYLANDFPISMLLVGVGLTDLGLYKQGRTFGKAVLGPTARRTTRYALNPFRYKESDQRREWRTVLKAIERNLVLPNHVDGTLSRSLSEYLFERSTGYMGSLISLITRGCARAVRTGEEGLTEELLDQVRIDVAAETERRQTAKLMRDCYPH
ncbi:TniB family NTP-binding protein [Mycolicibacterium goodii]|uniref:TniB family NTP-binding protein n=1 Tax=Mycolicibacterium goodii TaxID=134601 RepID=A0ABS6HZN3_MYCGD|nr:TniB family NTP-binding protein [Mycolicibacterium goodii]MBU8826955.1 TniB family NTP-binding protein [Mycolicibacterium goodii]MBU8841412.1 TniB family NTP-binding protein [Mycolicibacterium goodii]OKH71840.1 hypothetical protein EB74_24565 [Mycobacterium sp. SWH-M5]